LGSRPRSEFACLLREQALTSPRLIAGDIPTESGGRSLIQVNVLPVDQVENCVVTRGPYLLVGLNWDEAGTQ
jgi:hypothetical protein